MILHEKNKLELGINSETCSTKLKIWCQCDYCQSITLRTKYDVLRTRKIVNKDSCSNKDCMKQKRQESQLAKFGCKNYTETEEFKEKAAKTNKEKYGVEHCSQSKEFKERVKKTCLEKYGVEHYLATEKSKQERKEICLEKYGVEHYSQTEERQEKIKQTFLENYGVEHYSKTEEFKNKCKESCQEKYGLEHYSKTEEYKQRVRETCMERYGQPYPINQYGKTQNQIKEWLNSYGFDFKSNYEILDGKEIDLFDANLKLGIEYCGLYWHTDMSPEIRDKEYHYEKWKKSKSKGIKLITIFEDEWINRNKQCKNFIISVIGKNKIKIHGRKCEIKEINKKQLNLFCESNHIQGKPKSTLFRCGLFFNKILIGCISLSNHHRKNDENIIVLNRLCFESEVHVAGGASKLFNKCIKWIKNKKIKSIISWSDNRWSSGNIYSVLGFKNDGELKPDYSYVDLKSITRKSKQSQMKKNTKCPEDKTEKEWALQNGLARIWDCGKIRWKYNIEN